MPNFFPDEELALFSSAFLTPWGGASDLQDDESLRRWKEQLLGGVDLNSVGGKTRSCLKFGDF
jgi:hypothetical protein